MSVSRRLNQDADGVADCEEDNDSPGWTDSGRFNGFRVFVKNDPQEPLSLSRLETNIESLMLGADLEANQYLGWNHVSASSPICEEDFAPGWASCGSASRSTVFHGFLYPEYRANHCFTMEAYRDAVGAILIDGESILGIDPEGGTEAVESTSCVVLEPGSHEVHVAADVRSESSTNSRVSFKYCSGGSGVCTPTDNTALLSQELRPTYDSATDEVPFRTLRSGGANLFGVYSPDGSQIHHFRQDGRIERTADNLTGETLLSFSYDSEGRIQAIIYGDSQDNTLPRVTVTYNGNEAEIEAPGGQLTHVAINPITGYAERIRGPEAVDVGLLHDDEGRLMRMIDSRGGHHSYSYDHLGRLQGDEGPEGHTQWLTQVPLSDSPTPGRNSEIGYEVTHTSAEEQESYYSMKRTSEGSLREIVEPNGAISTLTVSHDDVRTTTTPDGTKIIDEFSHDGLHGSERKILTARRTTVPATASHPARTRVESFDESLSADKQTLEKVFWDGEKGASPKTTVLKEVLATPGGGSRTTLTSPENRQVVTEVDNRGRIRSMQVGTLPATVFEYYDDDDPGQRLKSVTSGSRETTYAYYATGANSGTVRSVTTSEGTVEFGRDAFGRPTSATAGGVTNYFEYDESGNLKVVETPTEHRHTQNFDLRNLLASYSTPMLRGPLLFAGGDTNLYVYVYNNPVNLVDPVGLWGVTVSVGGGFASGFGSGFVPVGGGSGDVGFFIGTEGFGTVKSVHYTNGVGAYAGAGLSLGAYHSLDRLSGYSLGGKVVGGKGLIGGATVDFTTDGDWAAASLDIGGGAAAYAGGTWGATSISNWFENMRDFFLEGFDRNHGKDRDCK